MYYDQKTSVLDVNENSKETSAMPRGSNGGLGGLMEDLGGTQIGTFFAYMPRIAFDFAGKGAGVEH